MKMKTISKILFLAVFLLPIAACSDFLEEDPKGRLSNETFFSNEAELTMSIHALYKRVTNFHVQNDRMTFLWMGDDICTHPASNKQIYREFDNFSPADDNAGIGNGWSALFSIVKASNYIINNADRTPIADRSKIDQAIGQAMYWRAYSYFYLAKVWGAVPVMLSDGELNYEATLTPAADVFNLVVEDLKKAETLLPVNWSATPWVMNGMNIAVSQGAAKATLAYVYLNMAGWPLNQNDKYALAAQKAKEVIDGVNGGTYYYGLLSEYSQVHSWEYNYKNKEVIAAVYFNKDWGWEDNCMSSLCDILDEAGGWGDSCGEIGFWSKFPDSPRKQATYAPKTLRNSSDKALVDWWECAGPTFNPWFIKSAEGLNRVEYDYTLGGTRSEYLGEKAHHIVRLSEVYCWYAEAIGRSGGNDAAAYEALNKVRVRAGLDEIPSGSLSAAQLAEAAYDEHGWEIAGYYWGNIAPRFFDMQRMNRVKDHFEYRKANAPVEVAPGVFMKESITVNGSWQDKLMYADYPARDVLMNPNLKR